MATFTKFADNEMNYYQFKARQILLQKKEDKEWQDFCKQTAPDCAACLAERVDVKESKDVGIQAFPKKPSFRTDKTPLQPKNQKEEIPEALINIKTRLEKIDLALSKLFDESQENEKASPKHVLSRKKSFIQDDKSHIAFTSEIPSHQALKTFEEQRKLQIQNSFRTSLQNSVSVVPKKSPAIKPRNSSFLLPRDLEVKRIAARKAYLASLQTKPKVSLQNTKPKMSFQTTKPKVSLQNTKPKVSFQNTRQSNEKINNSQSKKSIPIRKKILPKKENQMSKEDPDTLIETFEADDAKDENIEDVVDAIFEDLLGEAALDLNRIRLKKREKYCSAQNEISDNTKKSSTLHNPSTSSPMKFDYSKFEASDDRSIMKLKMFIDSFDVMQEENYLSKKQIELADKGTSPPVTEDSKTLLDKRAVVLSNLQREPGVSKTVPKFVCDVTNIIKINPEKAKDIASERDRFWKYLEKTSQTAKGGFNPWILNETLAESILDDCINDIAEELSEMPSSIIQDLYNHEFVQHVEI